MHKELKAWRDPGSLLACSLHESACDAGGPGSIPGLGRSPGEGNGYPLHILA